MPPFPHIALHNLFSIPRKKQLQVQELGPRVRGKSTLDIRIPSKRVGLGLRPLGSSFMVYILITITIITLTDITTIAIITITTTTSTISITGFRMQVFGLGTRVPSVGLGLRT